MTATSIIIIFILIASIVGIILMNRSTNRGIREGWIFLPFITTFIFTLLLITGEFGQCEIIEQEIEISKKDNYIIISAIGKISQYTDMGLVDITTNDVELIKRKTTLGYSINGIKFRFKNAYKVYN